MTQIFLKLCNIVRAESENNVNIATTKLNKIRKMLH